MEEISGNRADDISKPEAKRFEGTVKVFDEIGRMNSAPAKEQLSLLAAVVTHMQQHRTGMADRMEEMQGKMMTHMMQHMEMGEASMSQCPMMKGMMNMGK